MASALDSSLGAILVGCVVSSIFYGITSLQTFFYFNHYSEDRLLYRAAVSILWLLDTVHISFVVFFLYHYTISNPGTMFEPEWSSAALIIITNISDLLIRTIFLYRIWYLSERKKTLFLAPMALVVLSTAVIGIFYGVEMRTLSFTDITRISWALYATLTGDVLADLGITTSLCLQFNSMRSGIKRTDNFLMILIAYTVNTGLLTCAIAVSTLVTYALMPHNYIFMGIFFVLNKASFNSLLATLNARAHLLQKGNTIQIDVKTPTIASFGPPPQTTLVDEDASIYSNYTSSMGMAV